MPRAQFFDAVLDVHGEALLAKATVYYAPAFAPSGLPLTDLATVYSSETAPGTLPNPYTATLTPGFVGFWVEPGSYDVKLEDAGSPPKTSPRTVRFDAIPPDHGVVAAMIANDAVTASAIATGAVGSGEIADGTVQSDDLQPGLADRIGVSSTAVARRGRSVIAASGSRTSTAYGALSNGPDVVPGIVLPTDGLIVVGFNAVWQNTASGAGRAAIFLNSAQLSNASPGAGGADVPAEASGNTTASVDSALTSAPAGLAGFLATNNYTGPVTTGEAMAGPASGNGGPCYIFAAAGTYDVSVQFRATSGTVSARSRKLWVWTIGF